MGRKGRDRVTGLDIPRNPYEAGADPSYVNKITRRPSPSPRITTPKSSRPISPSRSRALRKVPFARRLRYTFFAAILLTFVIIYVTTGESSTRNSEFYKRTVALMEAKARGQFLHEEGSEFPSQPLHRAGGLHFAESGGHGKGGNGQHKGPTDDSSKEGKSSNGGSIADKEQRPPNGPAQRPLVEDASLKDRLKAAEKNAKKSADDKYRALKDIEAEVEKERELRKDDLQPGSKPKKAPDPMSSIIEANAKVNADNTDASDMGTNSAKKEEEAEQIRVRSLLAEIFSRSAVTIFSKTYCPHSARAKHILLEAHSILPEPHVVELDVQPDGPALQGLLAKTTGRRTVPNVLVNGKSIGGGDETAMLWKSGELPARIKQMAGKRVTGVTVNFAFGKEPGTS